MLSLYSSAANITFTIHKHTNNNITHYGLLIDGGNKKICNNYQIQDDTFIFECDVDIGRKIRTTICKHSNCKCINQPCPLWLLQQYTNRDPFNYTTWDTYSLLYVEEVK